MRSRASRRPRNERQEEVRDGAGLLRLDFQLLGPFGSGFVCGVVGLDGSIGVRSDRRGEEEHGGPRSGLRPVGRLERRVADGVLPARGGGSSPGPTSLTKSRSGCVERKLQVRRALADGSRPARPVGLDVSSPEAVDRLLRVADEESRRARARGRPGAVLRTGAAAGESRSRPGPGPCPGTRRRLASGTWRGSAPGCARRPEEIPRRQE